MSLICSAAFVKETLTAFFFRRLLFGREALGFSASSKSKQNTYSDHLITRKVPFIMSGYQNI
jgi:hypothetical protein